MNRLEEDTERQGCKEEANGEPKAIPTWAVLRRMIHNLLCNKSHRHFDKESSQKEVVNDPESRREFGREPYGFLNDMLVIPREDVIDHAQLWNKNKRNKIGYRVIRGI